LKLSVGMLDAIVERISASVTESYINFLIRKIPLFLSIFYDHLPDLLKRVQTEKLHIWLAEYCAENGIYDVDVCVTKENILATLDKHADELDIDKAIAKLPKTVRDFASEVVDMVARLIAIVKRNLNIKLANEDQFLEFLLRLLEYGIATSGFGNVPNEVQVTYRRLVELRAKYPNLTRRVFGWLLDKALEVEASGEPLP